MSDDNSLLVESSEPPHSQAVRLGAGGQGAEDTAQMYVWHNLPSLLAQSATSRCYDIEAEESIPRSLSYTGVCAWSVVANVSRSFRPYGL